VVSNEAVFLQDIEMALMHQFRVISVIKDVSGNVSNHTSVPFNVS
jgi:hypothetical protein